MRNDVMSRLWKVGQVTPMTQQQSTMTLFGLRPLSSHLREKIFQKVLSHVVWFECEINEGKPGAAAEF